MSSLENFGELQCIGVVHIFFIAFCLYLVYDESHFSGKAVIFPLSPFSLCLSLQLPEALPITLHYYGRSSYCSLPLPLISPSVHVSGNLSIMSTVYSLSPSSNFPSPSPSICSLHCC